MNKIRLAIAGVGNCASSLVQGIHFYAQASGPDASVGLARPTIGGFGAGDIDVVAAFDIDARKVGRPLNDAIFAAPNNTKIFHRPPAGAGTVVQMASVLDGVADHMNAYPESLRFVPAEQRPVDLVDTLRRSGAEILVSYMPVGAQKATEHFAEACLAAGVGFINCVPVFIVSDPQWADRFRAKKLPCIGDDIKAQVGATITHRTLARLFESRGVRIDNTYQLNTGGNTDFLNMLNRQRLASKKISKTEAVQSQLDVPLDAEHIHIGPSDFVPFLKDNKVAFIRIEGTGFGGVPLNMELRLSVEDSPNSAGVVIDAIRCCKLALDSGISGPIESVSAWTMKHPPRQMSDGDADRETDAFIRTSAKVES